MGRQHGRQPFTRTIPSRNRKQNRRTGPRYRKTKNQLPKEQHCVWERSGRVVWKSNRQRKGHLRSPHRSIRETVAPHSHTEDVEIGRIQTLKDWILKPEELGKKVEGPGGAQVWSHVKWAAGLASRVRDAEDTTGFLLGDVYKTLPRPVRDLIRTESQGTYNELAAAVLALDTADLKDAAAAYARDEETARLASEPPSPTKALRDALSTTYIQPPRAMNQPSHPAAQNPFLTAGGQGNLFGAARGNMLPFRGSGPGALGMGRGTNIGEGAATSLL